MRACALALILAGCGFSSVAAENNGQDGGGSDPTAGVVHICLGTFVSVCADAPRVSLNLMTGTINTSDTSSSSKCLPPSSYTTSPAGLDVCVIAAQTITIPSTSKVSATGARPLVLLAGASLTISGTLDAASHHGGLTGPAADSGPCPTNFQAPTTAVQGGGGWGGTFGQPGNNGGNTLGGAMGGVAGSLLQIPVPGGGCPGGKGANNGGGNGGGNGGHGGGAVLLLGGQTILVDGTVNASGAGGSGGNAVTSGGGGGGGGGAGGLIILDAPAVMVPGKCFANGGGGGEGSSILNGNDGGESSAPDKPGGGGNNGSPIGGDGGAGGVGSTGSLAGKPGSSITNPFTDSGGGGAGGGGVGIIKIFSGSQADQSIHDPKKVAPPPS